MSAAAWQRLLDCCASRGIDKPAPPRSAEEARAAALILRADIETWINEVCWSIADGALGDDMTLEDLPEEDALALVQQTRRRMMIEAGLMEPDPDPVGGADAQGDEEGGDVETGPELTPETVPDSGWGPPKPPGF